MVLKMIKKSQFLFAPIFDSVAQGGRRGGVGDGGLGGGGEVHLRARGGALRRPAQPVRERRQDARGGLQVTCLCNHYILFGSQIISFVGIVQSV